MVEDLARQNDLARAAVAQAQARRRSLRGTRGGGEQEEKGGGGASKGGGGLSFGVRRLNKAGGAPSERLMDELEEAGWSFRFLIETLRQLRAVHQSPIAIFHA